MGEFKHIPVEYDSIHLRGVEPLMIYSCSIALYETINMSGIRLGVATAF